MLWNHPDAPVPAAQGDEIGGIPSFRDTKGLVENEETVSFDTGYKFFKLRIKQR